MDLSFFQLPANHPQILAHINRSEENQNLIAALTTNEKWAWDIFRNDTPRPGTFLHHLSQMITHKVTMNTVRARAARINHEAKKRREQREEEITREWGQGWIDSERQTAEKLGGSAIVCHDGTVMRHRFGFGQLVEPTKIDVDAHEVNARNAPLDYLGTALERPPGSLDQLQRWQDEEFDGMDLDDLHAYGQGSREAPINLDTTPYASTQVEMRYPMNIQDSRTVPSALQEQYPTSGQANFTTQLGSPLGQSRQQYLGSEQPARQIIFSNQWEDCAASRDLHQNFHQLPPLSSILQDSHQEMSHVLYPQHFAYPPPSSGSLEPITPRPQDTLYPSEERTRRLYLQYQS
ncbi:hypothetical protein CC80DRAFT_567428 [Byssothecium circinans]|uniref:Uncharacterized protein n=1 Tax=Byssothecium circinans TaxID=147558 RepID=A0A6A5TN39_9PLEO|nr:hypothetical protein CC80DRAFT_567428 [Byssothecium circinans]